VARVGYGEHNQRSWLALWSQHLAAAPAESLVRRPLVRHGVGDDDG
jgi:hypothetical protein